MKISYIIVAYNSENLLYDCINSIIKYNYNYNYEIIVVDNSPLNNQYLTKNICELFNNILYIPNINNGFGQGNNVGIKASDGDLICIINPDVRFIEPFVEIIMSNFKSDNRIALIGLKQIGGNDLSFYLKPEFYFPFLNSIIIKLFNKINFFYSKFFFLSGACFFVSKKKFEKIQLFDENIFMFYEEADISHRFLKESYKIKYVKSVKYEHLVGNRKNTSSLLFGYELDSLRYYFKKYNYNIKPIYFLKKVEYFVVSKVKLRLLNSFINENKKC